MQRNRQVWPSLGGALLLFGGVLLLPLTEGLIFGDVQGIACSLTMPAEPAPPSEASARENKLLSNKPAKHRVIRQPVDSVPAPDQEADCIFWPMPPKALEAMLKLAEVKAEDVLFDLGSGDGRVCIAAAKTYGARAYGYEIQERLVKKSLQNVRKNKVAHLVTIEHRDIFKLDLSEADVVTLWLLPYLNMKLIPQLEKMKPGSRIVSLDFDMGDIVKPNKVIEVEVPPEHKFDSPKRKIYLWKTPLERDEERFRHWFPKAAGDKK